MKPYPYIALALLAATSAMAAESVQPQYNVVSLQAEARRDMANDLVQANLYVEMSDANAATLSDKLNRATAEAIKIAKSYASIKVATSNNSVYPLYNKNKADGWRGRSDIRLESTDLKATAELISKLQTTMQLGGVSFAISPAAREKVETELIDEAVKAFRLRADVAKKSIGGASYKLVNLAINTSPAAPGQMYRPTLMRASIAMADAAPPPMEAGDSQIVVGVSGSIEIQ